VVHDKRMVYV